MSRELFTAHEFARDFTAMLTNRTGDVTPGRMEQRNRRTPRHRCDPLRHSRNH
ncbi:hypothetical protein [Krasilnikovia sp. M28-CT-15]|uniref:hypothetical protein n=1 Tax=Krasilnikovia sp. M28-CT-15 TaxID=3373540 RepID=UPI00399C889A